MKILNVLLRPIENRIFESCHRTQKLQFARSLRLWLNFARVVFFLYAQCLSSLKIFFFQ